MIKKIESLNKHENPSTNTNVFDIENYLNANWDTVEEVINNNAKELEQAQKDIQINAESIEEINKKDSTQDNLIEEIQTENTKLKKTIESMQIPGEEVGNPIHISDSSDMECEIVPIGGVEQETREGYNKITYPYNFVDSVNTTIQDDSANSLIVENTTPGSNSYFFIDNINLEADKTYTISRIYEIMTGTKTDETAQIELYLAGTWKKVLLYQSSSLSTFSVDTSGKYRIVIKNGNSSSALKVKYTNLMILEGAYTADTLPPYEQYGASPSPDYPSEIVTVGQNGSVEIKVDNGLETTDTNYQSYTKVLPIQKEFVKIGDVEDTFVKVDGKWYEKHNIPIYIFTGNEYFIKVTNETTILFRTAIFSSKLYLNDNNIIVKSNIATGYANVDWKAHRTENVVFGGANGYIQFVLPNITTVENFKNQLAEKYANGTPVVAYYVLREPELIPCTAEQESILNSFYTYKGITNISVDGIGTLKVNYKKDLETIINNLSATSVAE